MVAMALAVSVIPVSGCDLRLDTGDTMPQEFDLNEVARQRAAWCATVPTQQLMTLIDPSTYPITEAPSSESDTQGADSATEDKTAATTKTPPALDEKTINKLTPIGKTIIDHQQQRAKAFGKPWPTWDGLDDAPTLPAFPDTPTNVDQVADALMWCSDGQRQDTIRVSDPHLAQLLFSSSVALSLEATTLSADAAHRYADNPKEAATPSTVLVLNYDTNTYETDKDKTELALGEAVALPDPKATPPEGADDSYKRVENLIRDMDAGRYTLGIVGGQLAVDRRYESAENLISIIDRIEGEIDRLAVACPHVSRDVAYPTVASASGVKGVDGRAAGAFNSVISSRIGLIGMPGVPGPTSDTWRLITDCERKRAAFASSSTSALPGITLSSPAKVAEK